VLYFYSAHALEAHVKVAFPKGLITEWYPQARAASGAGPRNGGIEWEGVKHHARAADRDQSQPLLRGPHG
jgi:hypothetical protein